MTGSISRQIDDAVAFAKTSPFPSPAKLCDEVYA
jgi:TPP-dependent pyruvate/acetoin dehydrogenase alpha subunit